MKSLISLFSQESSCAQMRHHLHKQIPNANEEKKFYVKSVDLVDGPARRLHHRIESSHERSAGWSWNIGDLEGSRFPDSFSCHEKEKLVIIVRKYQTAIRKAPMRVTDALLEKCGTSSSILMGKI